MSKCEVSRCIKNYNPQPLITPCFALTASSLFEIFPSVFFINIPYTSALSVYKPADNLHTMRSRFSRYRPCAPQVPVISSLGIISLLMGMSSLGPEPLGCENCYSCSWLDLVQSERKRVEQRVPCFEAKVRSQVLSIRRKLNVCDHSVENFENRARCGYHRPGRGSWHWHVDIVL